MTGTGSSCGACKFLRRKCSNDCVFAPYFSYDQASAHFSAVHKVFGASNVSKLLLHLPVQNRSAAAITISFEALARMRDPVYGCVSHIFALQQQVMSLQEEIELLGTQMANFGYCQVPTYQSNKTQQQLMSQLQPVTMQDLHNQTEEAINFTSFGDQFMYGQLGENCLHHDQFFIADPQVLVNHHPWLLNMDYYTTLMDVENPAWN
ncbi:PREDICTED: LOB domain-containing protein 33 [Tarenaya hassleriana]|uniref:LOB domain-containing protein 33 n=1 Tax=Tarenaya hassleriana TaxID=28532 RepID=UPI00053C6A02|nr:PREDICTED: LOB domain-containing protein 33 [Tarenaya hassleriana]